MITSDMMACSKIEIIARDGAPIDSLLELLGVQIDTSKSFPIRDLVKGESNQYVSLVCCKANE